jgi:tetratricopeptide (TPR) repeat protein/HAMP domain-containing protein
MMKLHKDRSLRVKLTLYPAMLFVVVGLIGTLINLQITSNNLNSLGEKYTTEILKAKLFEFRQTFERNIVASRYMAANSTIREWMKDEDNRSLEEPAFETFRRVRSILLGEDTSTFVALDSGHKRYFVNAVSLTTLNRDIADHAWYWRAINSKDLTVEILYDAVTLSMKLRVYVPVWEGERLLGVTGTDLDVSSMINQMVALVSEGAHVILFNERGHVKAHIIPEHIDNRKIFELVGKDGARVQSIMDRLDTDGVESHIISEFIKYRGKNYTGSFAAINIHSATWYILVLMDVDTIIREIIVPLVILLIITLLLILGALAWLINRIVLIPLGVIDSNLSKIMERDFSVRIDLATGDELTTVANTINMMTANIREYTENLEGLVAERTKQLQEAFEEVNALKVQQDGDYFLTSLLINPLLVKEVQSDTLLVDFYVSQKKKFTFKQRAGEIGGDLCIAREIMLMDKRYLAVTNADAMGKSLQGAGGALVMAVIFHSYANRTPLFPSIHMRPPESWLTEIYEELHRVFVSFDGSMLISAVIALIDAETGAMYYINAEHPWTACYRNGKAEFTEDELTLRKIGTMVFGTDAIIRTKQLQSKDVIFLGSDGRDDIMTGVNAETGQRIINEDELRFLRCIEEADGNLDRLVEAIEKDGELTDDFTLIRIEWTKPPLVAPPDFEAVRSSANKAFAEKDFPRAIQLLRKAMYLYPDPEVIERLVACHRERGETQEIIQTYQYGLKNLPLNETLLYNMVNESRRMVRDLLDGSKKGKEDTKKASSYIQLAIDSGERLLNTNPRHFKGLLHVADCYRMLRRFNDAKALLARAREIVPDDENLKVIERMLERDEAAHGEKSG